MVEGTLPRVDICLLLCNDADFSTVSPYFLSSRRSCFDIHVVFYLFSWLFFLFACISKAFKVASVKLLLHQVRKKSVGMAVSYLCLCHSCYPSFDPFMSISLPSYLLITQFSAISFSFLRLKLIIFVTHFSTFVLPFSIRL